MAATNSFVPSLQSPTATTISSHNGNIESMASLIGKSNLMAFLMNVKPVTFILFIDELLNQIF
jgi:hypothetical protein